MDIHIVTYDLHEKPSQSYEKLKAGIESQYTENLEIQMDRMPTTQRSTKASSLT